MSEVAVLLPEPVEGGPHLVVPSRRERGVGIVHVGERHARGHAVAVRVDLDIGVAQPAVALPAPPGSKQTSNGGIEFARGPAAAW